MKKTGLLLLLCAVSALAQMPESAATVPMEAPQNTLVTNASFPFERVQTPTAADLYCAGFITKESMPDANFVAGGLNSPSTTKFANGDSSICRVPDIKPASSTASFANCAIQTR